jgi:hypothetical protein
MQSVDVILKNLLVGHLPVEQHSPTEGEQVLLGQTGFGPMARVRVRSMHRRRHQGLGSRLGDAWGNH